MPSPDSQGAPSGAADLENRLRWTGAGGHYEVWYATLSDPATQVGYWIRYTMKAPLPGHGTPYAQLWFARFDGRDPSRTFGINRRFPIASLTTDEHPFALRIGEARLTSGSAEGALAGGGHDVRWNLRWRPAARPSYHLPALAYKGSWAPTQVRAATLDARADGEIVVDGVRHPLTQAPLGQTHINGKKHAYAWAWSHCNAFEGADAAVETLTVRLRRAGVVLPPLTLVTLRDGEEEWRLNDFKHLPFNRSRYGTGRYWLRAEGARGAVEIEYTCRPEDMILAEYEDPDGEAAFCHNTECADARVEVWRRSPFVGRLRHHRTLRAHKTAHYEWAARAGDPLVTHRHVTLPPAAEG